MKEDLKEKIVSYASFDEEELFDILSRFEYETLKKGEWFYTEGKICKKIAFVRKGAVRSYYNLDGEEVTRFVMTEGSFFTAFESFFSQNSSPEYVQAIENTDIYTLSYNNMYDLFGKYAGMLKLGNAITIESHIRLEKRVFNLIALGAEERYKKFTIDQADLLKRIPLQYVASILGMKPETLSRIRKKLRTD